MANSLQCDAAHHVDCMSLCEDCPTLPAPAVQLLCKVAYPLANSLTEWPVPGGAQDIIILNHARTHQHAVPYMSILGSALSSVALSWSKPKPQ